MPIKLCYKNHFFPLFSMHIIITIIVTCVCSSSIITCSLMYYQQKIMPFPAATTNRERGRRRLYYCSKKGISKLRELVHKTILFILYVYFLCEMGRELRLLIILIINIFTTSQINICTYISSVGGVGGWTYYDGIFC